MAERIIAGRYRLIRPLGRGGMGAVWLGEDLLAGRQVAVKEVRAPDGVSDAERDVFRKRALQEARSAARLSHPNAVTLHDIIPASADDAVYLILEYVDGVTLAQLVQRDGPLGEARTTGIAFQLLSILDAAHALGIVHRDIKPANIMITAGGQVKLTDFGIAHVVGGTRLTGSGVIGTPAYMAPEQLQGLDISPAMDLWALGVTLYDAVAGRNPFDRETTAATFHAILMGDLPPAPCGPPLGGVIAGLLVRDPVQRLGTAQAREMLAAPTAWSAPPAAGAAGRGGGPQQRACPPGGPATYPGNQAGNPGQLSPATWPPAGGTPPAGGGSSEPGGGSGGSGPGGGSRPRGRRRSALIAVTAAVVVVVAAGTAVVVTSLNSGGAGTPVAGRSSASSGPATSPAASPVTSSATTPASAGGGRVPSAYLGQWHGTLADNTGLQGPQTTDLTLTGGAGGTVVGSVNYSDVGCQYQLRLVSTSAAMIELFEEIKSGACYSEYVVLTASGNGMTESVYPSAATTGPANFSGVLTKAT